MNDLAAAHVGGAGSTMVLLHDVLSSWRAWRPLLAALESHHTVLAPTLRGHNGGGPLAADPRRVLSSLVDGVERAMDATRLGRAHIVGNGLGGWVGLELARRGRARSVTALSPMGAWREPGDLERLLRGIRRANRSWTAVPRLPVAGGVRRLVLGRWVARPDLLSAEAVATVVYDAVGCTGLDVLLDAVRSTGPVPCLLPVCPVMVCWGSADRLSPFEAHGRPLLSLLPAAELRRLPGVGHRPMDDDPALVAATVLGHAAAAERATGGGARMGAPPMRHP